MSDSLIPSCLVKDVSESSGHSPKMSDVRESLRLLTKNEQPWAIRSSGSLKMSDHEQITQVAHQKWGIRSENRRANSKPWLKWLNLIFFKEMLLQSFKNYGFIGWEKCDTLWLRFV